MVKDVYIYIFIYRDAATGWPFAGQVPLLWFVSELLRLLAGGGGFDGTRGVRRSVCVQPPSPEGGARAHWGCGSLWVDKSC